MREPKSPANEAQRMQRLRSYEILDTLPEEAYDDIVALASHIAGVPIALVSLVDDDRQWFKARHGLGAEETPRSVSFCGHVVETGSALVVADSHVDERFADNPLVTDAPHIRFYAGTPLRTSDDLVLGTLCVIDHEPREIDEATRKALESLARLVMHQLELRLERSRGEELSKTADSAQAEVEHVRGVHRRFFELSLELLCVAGADGYFKELNPAWSQLLGYSDDELMARPFIELVHPDDHAATVAETTALASRERSTINFVNRFRTKAGEWRWLSWNATFDPAEKNFLAAARDVTTQREYEASLEEARARAEQADRSKSQFLATMSHELRTPLNAIIGFSKILSKNKAGTLNDKELKFVDRIKENGSHLLSLINEVLDLSKIEAGQMTYQEEACEVTSIVGTVVRLQESLASEKSLALAMDLPSGLDVIRADQQRLRQVLINLVSNAVKFTEKGGVTVRVLPRGAGPQVAAIEVIDTGIGIAKEDFDKVFRPFEQVDGKTTRSYSGTGLGLAISRSICEGMGMSLQIESELGHGTTFRIVIPAELSAARIAGESAQLDALEAQGASAEGVKRRVLVIDDNSDARQLIAEQFHELGCEVRLARDGAEGLRVARGWTPDLITVDLMMPTVNGWQVLSSLREEPDLAAIPVVVISMAAEEGRGTLAGAVDVLSKPVLLDDLARVLRRLQPTHQRALLIEDNADARMLLSRFLEDCGWEVAEAINGAEGLTAIEKYQPDVVFLDLMMPVMDGAEFLSRVRSNPALANLPIVVVTAKDLSEKERTGLLQQASAVLQKGEPLFEDLRLALATIGGGETPEAAGV